MDIISYLRGRITLAIILLAIIFMAWPRQAYINAPARIEPARHSDVFPPLPAKVIKIHVQNDIARIKGERQSYAARIGRQILRVLIRESDF